MCGRTAYHSHWGKQHHGHQYHHGARKHWKSRMAQWGYPPVNIEELNDQYVLSVYAAGYEKSDFQVKTQDDLLIIAVEKFDTESHPFMGWGHFGFKPGNFRKEFEMNDKINREAISARYEEGILTVTLPKREGYETVQQDIGVA
jgi:HSP20 family protein